METFHGDLYSRVSTSARAQADGLLASPRMLTVALLLKINPDAAHALVGDAEADGVLHRVALALRDATSCSTQSQPQVHENPQGLYVNQVTSADFEGVPDPRPTLRTQPVPALVMRAECDFINWDVTLDYRRAFPNSRLVYVPDAGHGIADSQPELYTGLLSAFLLDSPLPLPTYDSTEPPAVR